MKYTRALNYLKSDLFSRQDVLDSFRKFNPEYNDKSFNRHFTKLLSKDVISRAGENIYTRSDYGKTKGCYSYDTPSEEFEEIESLLTKEFPLTDFIIWESISLDEFSKHQVTMNTIIIMVEKEVMESFFYYLKDKFPSVLLAPSSEDIKRYRKNGTIVIGKLSYRYPKNTKQKNCCSIEKLVVDMFSEKAIKSIVSKDDYPEVLETMFERYKINETKLFSYAKARCVDEKIYSMINEQTKVKLVTNSNAILSNDVYELRDIIIELIDPDKIILFGSYAYGTPNERSDADFLVIKNGVEHTTKDEGKLATDIYYKRKKRGIRTRCDAFLETETQAYANAKDGGAYADALKKGKLIYVR